MRESVDDQAGLGLSGRGHWLRLPAARFARHEHRVLRSIPVPGVIDERQHDGEQDPLFDADDHDRQRGDQCHPELRSPLLEDLPHPGEIDQADSDQKHDGRQGRFGHVRQRSGQEEQDQQDDRRRHQERQLAAAAGAVDDLRLRWAAVDDEGAGQAGANIGQGQTDQVGVLAETLVVARGISAGGRRALRQDDHEHSQRRSEAMSQ